MNQVWNHHLLPLLLFWMWLVSPSRGLVPVSVEVGLRPWDYGTSTRLFTAKLEGIAHELQELGQEIQPHVFHVKHGFTEFKESLVHKLRRAVYEKDKLFHEALKELEHYTLHDPASSSMYPLLLATLQDVQQMLQEEPRVIELAWKSAEWELENTGRDAAESSVGSTFMELVHTLQSIEQELVALREQAIQEEEASKASQVLIVNTKSEDESVTRLLWRAVKLTGRRIKNALGFVLCFGRPRKTRQE